MDTTTYIIIAVVVLVAALAIVWVLARHHSARLRSRFGPEYTRALQDTGGRRRAEALLHQRERRVRRLTIRPLTPADRDRYMMAWRKIQSQFVDNPTDAVVRADALLGQVMADRGYPDSDYEQRVGDLSVRHPVVVQSYRMAHDIAERHARGQAGTEDMRQAMIHFRTLFDELIDERAPASAPVDDRDVPTGAVTA